MKQKPTVLLCVTIAIMQLAIEQTIGQFPGANQVELDPAVIPQFVDPLPHFAGTRVDVKDGGNLIIKEVPHKQVILSTGTVLDNGIIGKSCEGKTNVWVYTVSKDGGETWTPPNWPAYSIEARRGYPINVTYVNALYGQSYRDVNLMLDQTIMWVSPKVTGDPMAYPYLGPVPMTVHIHGLEVQSESDGRPDSWFTPGYTLKGPAWTRGVDQYYSYPNTQQPATLWFHDHVLGAAHLNIYAGLTGFYFLRGTDEINDKLPGWPGDDMVKEETPMRCTETFNSNPYLPEIELCIQDRKFDTKGELYYTVKPQNQDVHPFWTPQFFGPVMTVNGKAWPYFSVAPRKYRFRVLNGSNSRFINIWLQDLNRNTDAPSIIQIGTDGAMIDAPLEVNPNTGGKLLLAPGERADIVIDFSRSAPETEWTLMNAANTPFPDGDPVQIGLTDRIMKFVVNGKMVSSKDHHYAGTDNSDVPNKLRSLPIVKLTNFEGRTKIKPVKTRQIVLNEVKGPLELQMVLKKLRFAEMSESGQFGKVTELPVEGTTEIWKVINTTKEAHPIHVHLAQFQVTGKQRFDVEAYLKKYTNSLLRKSKLNSNCSPSDYTQNETETNSNGPAVSPYLQEPVIPVSPCDRGWKDTYKVLPGEVATLIIRFTPCDLPLSAPSSALLYPFDPSTGPGYVWSCHMLDHNYNEMVKPYYVTTSPYRTLPKHSDFLVQDGIQNKPVEGYALEQNTPNPFSTKTAIRFKVPVNIHAQLTLYGQLGEEVQKLFDAEAFIGNNTVIVDTHNLDEGVYFYQLKAGDFREIKRLLIDR